MSDTPFHCLSADEARHLSNEYKPIPPTPPVPLIILSPIEYVNAIIKEAALAGFFHLHIYFEYNCDLDNYIITRSEVKLRKLTKLILGSTIDSSSITQRQIEDILKELINHGYRKTEEHRYFKLTWRSPSEDFSDLVPSEEVSEIISGDKLKSDELRNYIIENTSQELGNIYPLLTIVENKLTVKLRVNDILLDNFQEGWKLVCFVELILQTIEGTQLACLIRRSLSFREHKDMHELESIVLDENVLEKGFKLLFKTVIIRAGYPPRRKPWNLLPMIKNFMM